MGVIGCYLAWRFWEDGVPFTWNDTEEPVTAWRACTGAIFPTGHAEDQEAMAVWHKHFTESGFAGHMERAEYVFCTKAPPHGGRYEHRALVGDAKLACLSSLHLNAQTWVPFTRGMFAPAQRDPEPGAVRVITHGFGPRLDRFMWGWTMPVRLRVNHMHVERPCIYFRRGRFVMAYAYPIPNTDLWYAGSSLISQRVPKRLDIPPKFRRWRDQFLELGDGYILGVAPAGLARQGWRPVPAKDDTAWITRLDDGTLAARPLWHSGVRHAPHIYTALQEALA
jgi:hypothetical protein